MLYGSLGTFSGFSRLSPWMRPIVPRNNRGTGHVVIGFSYKRLSASDNTSGDSFTVLHAGVSTVRPYRNVKIGYTLRESMHMLIRHATMEDLDAIEAVEAACFPPAEAASNESLTARVAAYPDHFWLLVNTDDDDTPFPSRVEDGTLVGFVDGMATNEPNLADAMYDDADMHDEHGDWQMIFGVDVAPVYQHRGCASYLLRQVILDAAQAGRKGLVLTCKERLVDFYARLGFVDEGLSESTHGNVVWHQMRLALTHAVGTGNPTANGSAKTAERTNDADTTAMSGVDHDTETLEFPQVEPTA